MFRRDFEQGFACRRDACIVDKDIEGPPVALPPSRKFCPGQTIADIKNLAFKSVGIAQPRTDQNKHFLIAIGQDYMNTAFQKVRRQGAAQAARTAGNERVTNHRSDRIPGEDVG